MTRQKTFEPWVGHIPGLAGIEGLVLWQYPRLVVLRH